MVENIKDIKEYIEKKEAQKDKHPILQFELTHYDVEEWKKNKKFAHLKKELSVYNNLKFGCVSDDVYCRYYFICDNKEQAIRLLHLLKKLDSDKFPRLERLSNEAEFFETFLIRSKINTNGENKSCLLF